MRQAHDAEQSASGRGGGWQVCAREAAPCAILPVAPENSQVGDCTLPVQSGKGCEMECSEPYSPAALWYRLGSVDRYSRIDGRVSKCI